MRRAASLLAAAIFALVAVAVGAQATLVYAYGSVEIAEGGLWREVTLGSELPADATLRLGEASLAELASGGLRITLSRAGSYYLPQLVSASWEASRWSIATVVLNKVRALFSSRVSPASTNLGVRNTLAPGAGGVDGSEFSTEEELVAEQGRRYVAEGRYAQAVDAFREAVELADAHARPGYLLELGLALALAGENGAAQRNLSQIQAPESLERYGEYALLAARLAVDGQAYAEAEQLLLRFLDSRPGHPATQEALLLAAFCSRQQGRPEEAAIRLLRAIDLDPGTETAAAAAEALRRL